VTAACRDYRSEAGRGPAFFTYLSSQFSISVQNNVFSLTGTLFPSQRWVARITRRWNIEPVNRSFSSLKRMCLLRHNDRMKTISIRQLHEATGRCVRKARVTPLIVTDRGTRVALLKGYSPEDLPGRPFPARNPRSLPLVAADSTQIISEDRTGR
jgi:hypothetical protein